MSTKKPVPNPDHWAWAPEDQFQFITDAHQFYSRKFPTDVGPLRFHPPVPRVQRARHDVLTWFYHLGKPFHLRLSYEEFVLRVLSNWPDSICGPSLRARQEYRYYRREPKVSSWFYKRYCRENAPFREKRGYHRHTSHEKKTEVSPKQEWRDHKQFSRDTAKQSHGHPYKKWAKKFSNRKLRQKERINIYRETYENLFKVVPKNIFDPWHWD